jgi:hypothetical protein
MTTLTTDPTLLAVAPPAAIAPPRKARLFTDISLYILLTVLILGVWRFSRMGYYRSGDDVGYWMGVAGGVMMLLLFSYPLRKYFRFMQRLGKVKWWFVVHMVLGIGGPLLILMHTTFRLGSVNAAVALFSMLIVAGSGVIGRFLYLRIHRGLHGERNNLADLQRRAGLAEGEIKSRFRFAPGVAEKLLAFESQAAAGGAGWGVTLTRLVWLPVRQRMVLEACSADLRQRLRVIGKERKWTRGQLQRRHAQARSSTSTYLRSVVRVAQFSAYERVFALWHLLHVPFVYLLLITACFHVFAVHAY